MPRSTIRIDRKKLRDLRISKGYSQWELAEKAHLSKRTIENIEAGRAINPNTLNVLAGALGVRPTDLLLLETSVFNETVDPATASARRGNAPPLPPLLVGRKEELQQIVDLLRLPSGNKAKVFLVSGLGGVGKSVFVATLAHDPRITSTFPDGILWTQFGKEPDVASRLQEWRRVLLRDETDATNDVQQLSGELICRLRSDRVLLVLDDVWNEKDALPFLIGGRGCATLLTTRSRSVADALAPSASSVFQLGPLRDDESLSLLQALAPTVVEQYPKESFALVRFLGGLPLAIQIAGRLLNQEAIEGWDIKQLLLELQDKKRLFAEQVPSDIIRLANGAVPTLGALLQKSIDHLDAVTRKRFITLGVLEPQEPIDQKELAELWQAPDPRPTIRKLIEHGLLQPTGTGSFHVHPILAALAHTCTQP